PDLRPDKQLSLHHPGFEKAIDDIEKALVSYPLCEEIMQGGLMNTIECRVDVALNYPEVLIPLVDVAIKQRNTIHGTASGAEAVRAVQEVAFPDGFQYHLEQHLDHAVFERGDPQRALCAIALGDIDPSCRGWTEAPIAQLLSNVLDKGGLRLL